jgi:NAD(P)-dependent dehydrogenase (short-subunit alcohol dehydrogenase family)
MSAPPLIIITGATNGIGQAAALELARQGAHLGIVARNPAKAEATVRRITTTAPGSTVDVFVGDLALMGDIRRVAAQILDRYRRINILINNAGIQLTKQRTTTEGLPEMVAVNYLAPWLITSLLYDRLVESAPARVVMTASEGHRLGWSIDPATILTHATPIGRGGVLRAYGKSKLLDVLFTIELAERLARTGVTANCCCPGVVATGLGEPDDRTERFYTALSRTPLVRRPDQGARVLVRLATDPAFTGRTGEFVSSTPLAPILPRIPAVRDVALRKRLWQETERLLTTV